MSMIQIQDALVARYVAAEQRAGKRSCGALASRIRRGARNEADRQLAKLGFDRASRAIIIRDAIDVAELEILCAGAA